MFDTNTLIACIVMGVLGGTANVIISADSWDDLKKFSSFKRVVIGGIAGFLYNFLHHDYNFPNAVMTFVVGYSGTDFVQKLMEKLKK